MDGNIYKHEQINSKKNTSYGIQVLRSYNLEPQEQLLMKYNNFLLYLGKYLILLIIRQ